MPSKPRTTDKSYHTNMAEDTAAKVKKIRSVNLRTTDVLKLAQISQKMCQILFEHLLLRWTELRIVIWHDWSQSEKLSEIKPSNCTCKATWAILPKYVYFLLFLE
jgi:hypothetical protein